VRRSSFAAAKSAAREGAGDAAFSTRRLRAGFAHPHSGGAGARANKCTCNANCCVGTITSPRKELADDPGWNIPAKARPGAVRKTPPNTRPDSASQRRKACALRRLVCADCVNLSAVAKARAHRKMGLCGCALRRSIPRFARTPDVCVMRHQMKRGLGMKARPRLKKNRAKLCAACSYRRGDAKRVNATGR
jgi:hypothetical protein